MLAVRAAAKETVAVVAVVPWLQVVVTVSSRQVDDVVN